MCLFPPFYHKRHLFFKSHLLIDLNRVVRIVKSCRFLFELRFPLKIPLASFHIPCPHSLNTVCNLTSAPSLSYLAGIPWEEQLRSRANVVLFRTQWTDIVMSKSGCRSDNEDTKTKLATLFTGHAIIKSLHTYHRWSERSSCHHEWASLVCLWFPPGFECEELGFVKAVALLH